MNTEWEDYKNEECDDCPYREWDICRWDGEPIEEDEKCHKKVKDKK